MKIGYWIFGFFWLLVIGYWNLQPVWAVNMDSANFHIQGGDVNEGGGEGSSGSYSLSTTMGALAAGEFNSQGYVVKSGFQYIHSVIPFQFSVSNTQVRLGQLVPQVPQAASTDLIASFGSAGEYQVTASEEGPLRTQNGEIIADTTCDGAKNTCGKSTAKLWTLKNAYGFGYNMKGLDIPTDFTDANYFRPFPNVLANESPVVVMSNKNIGKNRQATMTFKANIPPDQATGSYETVINFVATPSF